MTAREPAGGRVKRATLDHAGRRPLSIGATVEAAEVHFRLWAPRWPEVELLLSPDLQFESRITAVRMNREDNGYFSVVVPRPTDSGEPALPGPYYKFKVGSGAFPDPASRFQPTGPHGPSMIIDAGTYRWTDRDWDGVDPEKAVIYEMHIGTFTPEGTWNSAMEQLPELVDLGVTVLEIMPVADFTGRFGWGYDGVNLYAPTRLYGPPDEFRAFVDRAHSLGLGVILDVVYNHVGPCGNYLKEFSEDYFTDRYKNEWGQALNFDGEQARPVREFFIGNAGYWIREFHLDGLRLDATQQIFDNSPNHILGAISRQVREAGGGRRTYLIAENEVQHSRLVRPFTSGGFGMQGIWNDDFHHAARVALTGRNEAYFQDYQGSPQEFVSTAKYGFLFQGQHYTWQKKGRGTPTDGVEPCKIINYLQNHDQVANSLLGLRIHSLGHPGAVRALTAFLLLSPGTPLLFQGQEFAASAPFLFFADHSAEPELVRLVAKGRREFLCQFESIASPECETYLDDPSAEATFERCKLDLAERQKNAGVYRMHRDLLRLRRDDPVLSGQGRSMIDGAVLGGSAFVIRYFGAAARGRGPDNLGPGDDRLLLVNLGLERTLSPMPEPLLAAPPGRHWKLLWSSESPVYGGTGMAPWLDGELLRLPGQSALVLAADLDLDDPGLTPPEEGAGGRMDPGFAA